MKADKISLEKAKQDKLFYFVANAVVYRESDGRCLILKRCNTEKVHPGKYCVPGGKLDWDDLDISKPTRMNGDVFDFENALENLLIREIKEECNLEVAGQLKYINSVAYIRPDGVPVMMIKLTLCYKSGEVKIEEGAFDDYAWVNEEEIKEYECINGIREEVTQAISFYKK
ncbi:MAG: NUDIX hydrolase [Candidatus Falkowbacteria bacterium]|nr:NUDIX hydrolase [Candidatus Falkowbacteria bacterium]